MKKILIGFVIVLMLLAALAAIGWNRFGVRVETGQGKYLIHDYLHITNYGSEMKDLFLSIRVYRADGSSELVQGIFPIWKKHEEKVVPVNLGWNNRITKCEFNGSSREGPVKVDVGF